MGDRDEGGRPPGAAARAGILLGLAAVYFAAGKLGLRLASEHASATAVWPPTGISLAALLILGRWAWPGIFAGALLVNLTTPSTLWDLPTCLGIATGNTLEGVLGSRLVERFARGRRCFERPRDVFWYAIFAAIAATAVSATFGVASLAILGSGPPLRSGPVWVTWWLGDAGGALTVAPFLILWGAEPRLRWTRARAAEAATLLALLVGVGTLVFDVLGPGSVAGFSLKFLSLPLLLWAGFRFGPRETATAALFLVAFAVWGAVHGRGPFAGFPQNEALIYLESFAGVSTLTALTVAAAVLERRRAELALVESEERTRLIVDSALDGVVTMDAQGKVTGWNPQAEKTFGWSRQETLGRTLAEIVIPERFRDEHRRGLERYAATGGGPVVGRRMELTALHRDGHEFPVEVTVVPFRAGGEIHFSGFVRDITDRRRLEESLRRRMEEIEALNRTLDSQKSELGAYHSLLTHDVSNFAMVLLGLFERLLLGADGPITGAQEDLLRRANRQALEMNRLAENARLMVRLREMGLPAAPEKVALQRALRHAIETVRVIHFDRPFDVQTECPGDLTVAGLPLIENILLNLIENAVRHNPKGTRPSLQVTAAESNGAVTLRIRGGTPPPPEIMDHLFEREVKGRRSTGHGLGLALVREIVERAGGRIEARSIPGPEGEVFEVDLLMPRK